MTGNVITISKFQGDINWKAVKEDGIDYAFSRLGEGKTYVDPTFIKNFKEAKNVGIKAGAWHIYRAKSSTPEEQANTIITTLKEAGFNRDDSLAIEVYNKRGDNAEATKEEMSDNLYKLISNLLDSNLPICNRRLYIKTNIDTWKNSVAWDRHPETFKICRIWPEQWRTNPDNPENLEPWGENKWKLWEFSSHGRVNGINGDVLISKSNPNIQNTKTEIK